MNKFSLFYGNSNDIYNVAMNSSNQPVAATTLLEPKKGDINNTCIKASFNGAKHSLSKDSKICQTVAKSNTDNDKPRGSGWGTPIGLGLKGGADTSIANAASGWGPPPPSSNPNATRGWGAPATPNTSTVGNGTSAWGAPGNASSSISTGMEVNK